MPDAVVSVRGLERTFPGGVRALRGVDLEVLPGDLVCVVGPNASGKSTLLRILAGLDRADAGEARVADAYLVPQESDLFPWLTVRENLLLGQGRSAHPPAEYRARMERWLGELGLGAAAARFPGQLSGGQRQQVSVLRAFLSGAPVLLLDEPFSRLDAGTRARLQQRTLDLWEQERPAILFVTHDLPEAAFMGDRVLLLDPAGGSRELPLSAPRPRDPWNPGLYSEDPVVAEVLTVFRRQAPAPTAAGSFQAGRRFSVWTLLSPLLVLGLWEVAARSGWLDARFFPGPLEWLAALGALATSGELWRHLAASGATLFAGLAAGSSAGLALGLMMGMSPRVREVVEPVLAMVYPIPKIAILPLLLLIFGIGRTAGVVVVALGAFFLLLLNTMEGVTEVRDATRPVARNLRLRGLDHAWRTLALGAMPWILTGLRTAVGYCVVLLVAAEFYGTGSGVGWLVWNSWQLFDFPNLYAGLLVLAVAGALLQGAVGLLSRAWSARRGGARGGGETVL